MAEMSADAEVLTIGESMGSVRASGMLRLGGGANITIAGAESNVAIGLSRLGHRVRWAGRLGDDEVGALVTRTLRAEGVDTAVMIDATRPTGLLLVETRIADISRVAYYRAGSAASALEVADVENQLRSGTRVLHITGITAALSASAAEAITALARRAAGLGVTISFDVNYRRKLWTREAASAVLAPIARTASIVFASDDELGLVAEGAEADAAAELLRAGVSEVVVKRGGDGAGVYHAGGTLSVPARRVPVVDTIGAGDAFTAGYLSALLDGEDVAGRLERGTTLGAFAVTAAGDWESLPTRAELPLLDQAAGSTVR
ncbi:sugar kinase [Diaminobutyricimonas sp. TR449]|uniref:sugar kinase n=1 Tax=Diaminobutyricimonas sp. TR449 TaxID=2708076 RepID=UPI001FBA1B98|nr:sugar kinase [Diaminobutyricimonas sp. TR449]